MADRVFVRAILAATLGANRGVYGPAYELIERTPREPGSGGYLDSEKYELKRWDLDHPDSIRQLLTKLNRMRHDRRALHRTGQLAFHSIDSDQMLAYSKRSPDASSIVLAVVNLDPHGAHSGQLEIPLDQFHLGGGSYEVVDLLTGQKFTWRGSQVYIELDPVTRPAHIFQIR